MGSCYRTFVINFQWEVSGQAGSNKQCGKWSNEQAQSHETVAYILVSFTWVAMSLCFCYKTNCNNLISRYCSITRSSAHGYHAQIARCFLLGQFGSLSFTQVLGQDPADQSGYAGDSNCLSVTALNLRACQRRDLPGGHECFQQQPQGSFRFEGSFRTNLCQTEIPNRDKQKLHVSRGSYDLHANRNPANILILLVKEALLIPWTRSNQWAICSQSETVDTLLFVLPYKFFSLLMQAVYITDVGLF